MFKETKYITSLLSTKEKMVVNSWLREPQPTIIFVGSGPHIG
jgi:hypothetical protein